MKKKMLKFAEIQNKNVLGIIRNDQSQANAILINISCMSTMERNMSYILSSLVT